MKLTEDSFSVGMRVKWKKEMSPPIYNTFLEIAEGEEGTIVYVSEHEVHVRLDVYHDLLDEWDNVFHFFFEMFIYGEEYNAEQGTTNMWDAINVHLEII